MRTTMSQSFHRHPQKKNNDPLQRIRTAGSISIPPELFEQLYLAPKNRVKGELRQTFGNPTPIGKSFLICFNPTFAIAVLTG
jgi:hypothetical protein